jgi:hypothetical protein
MCPFFVEKIKDMETIKNSEKTKLIGEHECRAVGDKKEIEINQNRVISATRIFPKTPFKRVRLAKREQN